MDIKLIACDLDGTLLNSQSRLSPYTQQVLHLCARRGIKIVFATGRAHFTIPEQVLNFPGADYVLASNGASVYSLKTKTLLQSFVLQQEDAQALIRYALSHRLGLELISGGRAYGEAFYFEHPEVFGFDERSVHYLKTTRKKIVDFDSFLKQNINKLQSIDFVLADPTLRRDIQQRFAANTSLYITSSHERIVEFSATGAGKGNALRYVLELEGLQKENLIAFGNAQNDLEMMQIASLGIATANSPPEIQKQADAVCASCENDGVAKFLAELLGFNTHNEI